MTSARSRRVQAQRKFAQGAYVPPNVGVIAAANESRRENAQDVRNVTLNHMTATNLLDVVSLQGLHTHLMHSQPVVLVERLRSRSQSSETSRDTMQVLPPKQRTPVLQPVLPAPKVPARKKRDFKRVHTMYLRSRRPSKLLYKRITTGARQLAAERKVTGLEKVAKSKKKSNTDQQRSKSKDFSIEDNKPLTYFVNCSSTPKKTDTPQRSDHSSPEPVAGPSGVQRLPEPAAKLINSEGMIMPRGAYYSVQTNIERWINNSNHESSTHNTVAPCVAYNWLSIQDVLDAPKQERDSRCTKCDPCLRINKLEELSTLLKTQVKFDLTGDETLQDKDNETTKDPMISPDADYGHLYLDLLPKHPSIMMKLKIHIVHGKELLSACLIPRSDARKNNQEFMLIEQEHLLDQLIETLKCSFEGNGRRMTISSVYSDGRSEIVGEAQELLARGAIFRKYRLQKRKKRIAAESRLADAADLHARIKAEKEAEVSRITAEKCAEVSRIEAEKIAEVSRIQREKEAEVSRVCEEYQRVLRAEVDKQTFEIDKEADAKDMGSSDPADPNAPGPSSAVMPEGGKLVEGPTFRPTKEEFNDPIAYFEKISPEASKYGICKIVPPPGWKPKCKMHDDIRFEVFNQYISRLFSRWGPAARELCGIKLCLQQQKINFPRPPLLDGIEINLPKLYHLVQRHGGLETVINKKRWGRVAEEMKFSKTPNTERKLDQIYVKYLLPYDTLSHQERQDIMRKVEKAWNRKNQILLDRAINPLHRQKRMLGLSDSSDDETEDEDTAAALHEAEDCITQGCLMTRAKFKRVATSAYENVFGQSSESMEPPSLEQIEEQYWRLLQMGTEHVCVYSASIDSGEEGYGFSKNNRHPWNLKMMGQHHHNVLRYLGLVLGVTVPTLHLGMLYSTSCWHKDPHALHWTEYQHSGPTRIWYGIPSEQTDNFRKAAETLCPTSCQNKEMWLASEIAMIPPRILREHNVSLSRLTQESGEFILSFPRAYTSCISTGYTESESVYFAPPSWLKILPEVFNEARRSCEPTMFSMEQLLLLMAKDQRTEKSLLKIIDPIYDKMLRDEVTNRQMLQEKGLKFIHELQSTGPPSRRRRNSKSWNVRDQDECEFCRAMLFLSKVKHLVTRNTSFCLEHAVQILDTKKYKNKSVAHLEVYVYVSIKELNSVGDDMKRRLEA